MSECTLLCLPLFPHTIISILSHPLSFILSCFGFVDLCGPLAFEGAAGYVVGVRVFLKLYITFIYLTLLTI